MNKSIQDGLLERISLAEDNTKKIRPPLKWAGGKYRILADIRKMLPEGKRLIEPFVGSGVVFLNTKYDRYTLNDKNQDLITYYKTLKKEGSQFIDYCRQFFHQKFNNADKYYQLREEFNQPVDDLQKSALFLYLNKHGYNGLCRYNKSGNFNVPFGRHKNTYFPEQEMRLFWKKSKRAALICKDFEVIMRAAQPGDVIYCDPPYVPLSDTSNFTAYSAGGFDAMEQKRLASLAKEISGKGVPVLISNHFTSFTKEIYSDATKQNKKLSVRRLISCNGSKREHVKEILALYLPS